MSKEMMHYCGKELMFGVDSSGWADVVDTGHFLETLGLFELNEVNGKAENISMLWPLLSFSSSESLQRFKRYYPFSYLRLSNE